MYNTIIPQFSTNQTIFEALFSGLSEEQIIWKPQSDKWCLLEVICHLYDEEREDFRARFHLALSAPAGTLKSIDPESWVVSRQYLQQDFKEKYSGFLLEREKSIEYLESLNDPDWESAFEHPTLGKMTAKLFITNWLAHDFLHIRQILQLKYEYLKYISHEPLDYAGVWASKG